MLWPLSVARPTSHFCEGRLQVRAQNRNRIGKADFVSLPTHVHAQAIVVQRLNEYLADLVSVARVGKRPLEKIFDFAFKPVKGLARGGEDGLSKEHLQLRQRQTAHM